MIFKFFKSKIFQNFLISYIAVAGITIIAGSITYYESLKIVKNKIIETGIESVETGMELLDAKYKELDGLINLMASDEIISELLEKEAPLQARDYYSIREIQNKLPSYKIINTFVQDIYLYYLKPDVIISTVYADVDPQRFYTQIFQYEGYDFESWKNELTSEYQYKSIWPEQLIVTNNVKKTLITYIQSFPMDLPTRFKCNVLLHIKAEDILKNFEGSSAFLFGSFLIVNRNGELITSRSTMDTPIDLDEIADLPNQTLNELSINGKKMTVIATTSSLTGLTAYAVIPSKIFLDQVEYIRTIYFSVSLGILLLMLLIGIYLAYRNSRPLDNLVSMIQKDAVFVEEATFGTYEYLRKSVSNLIVNNHELQNDLQHRLPLLQAGFIGRLLHGSFIRSENLVKASRLAQIDIEEESYIVLLIRSRTHITETTELDYADLDLMQVVIQNLLRKTVKTGHYSHNISLTETAVIIHFHSKRRDEIRTILIKQLTDLGNRVLKEYGITIAIGISAPVDSAMDISLAFSMAQKALLYLKPQEELFSFYEVIQNKISDGFFYPIEVEHNLIRHARTGDMDEVEHILDKIYAFNFQESTLTYTEVDLLLSEIKATINKVSKNIAETTVGKIDDQSPQIRELNQATSADTFFEITKDIFKAICIQVNKRKGSHNETLLQKIKVMIEKSFSDPNLGLTSIANTLNITESYLSSFFKEQTGSNFSSFIENLRMNKVQELIKANPHLTISEVSRSVGYVNDNTFYRACKRFFGISPRELRNKTLNSGT